MENNQQETHEDTREPGVSEAKAAHQESGPEQAKTQTKAQAGPRRSKPAQAGPGAIKDAGRPQRSSWPMRLTLGLSLLLTLMAIGGGYYLYLKLQEQNTRAMQLETRLQQRLDEPVKRLNQLEQQQLLDAKAYERLTELSKAQTQLQQRVAALAQRNPNHWMAAEADYLVRMAGRKLWLERDPQTAVSLLKAADERILAMKDPALMPVRKALARDIAATAAIKGTDIAGTVFTLDAIISQLDKLPLNRAEAQAGTDVQAEDAMTDSLSDWRQNLAKTWKALSEDFITIRKRTTDIAPLLAPDQQWYLLENIRNKLLQSQLALYNYDEVNYRQSLALARKWIQQYFNLNDSKTKETLAALDALATLKLDTVTLTQFESTPLLQELSNYGNLMAPEDTSL
ncbi:uroporphyrinogen-III C-methyltransferase [Shewanella sp. AS16]|uniref:uroporphyrinogen-III C-methyltransferase n=1 Tax=Shewanella sp. AS16 TaxID=2907625 RepID=UPI001F340D1F|nr:uroporphyrinogen-III C-methyltransferase [Shewanella sp. AS16]MCE9685974.1 uroporphyrinogen-III C-methyltransferase [Shewanella sp. AS16]